MDEKIRIILELHDKMTAALKDAEKAVNDFESKIGDLGTAASKTSDDLAKVGASAEGGFNKAAEASEQAARSIGAASGKISISRYEVVAFEKSVSKALASFRKDYYDLLKVREGASIALNAASGTASFAGAATGIKQLNTISGILAKIEENTSRIIGGFAKFINQISALGQAAEALRELGNTVRWLGEQLKKFASSKFASDLSARLGIDPGKIRAFAKTAEQIKDPLKKSVESMSWYYKQVDKIHDAQLKNSAKKTGRLYKSAGQSQKDFVDHAIKGYRAAQKGGEQFAESVERVVRKTSQHRRVVEIARDAQGKFTSALDATRKKLDETDGSVGGTIHSIGSFAGMWTLVKKEVAAFRGVLDRVRGALKGQASDMKSAGDGTLNFSRAVQGVSQKLSAGRASLEKFRSGTKNLFSNLKLKEPLISINLDKTEAKLKGSVSRITGMFQGMASRVKGTWTGMSEGVSGFLSVGRAVGAVTGTISKGLSLASRAATGFINASTGMKVAIVSAAGAVVGLSLAFGKLVHSAFTRGQEHFKAIESATLQYKFLYGSATQAEERIEELTEYAARTPFQLKGIVQANRLLLVFGGKALATQEMLSLIGDAAAVSGRRFEDVAFWIGRMYTLLRGGGPIGEATRALTEMGVIGGDLQNELNKMATSGAGLEATFGKLTEHMKKSQGATAELAQTLAGLETTVSDTFDLALSNWFEALEGDKLSRAFKNALIGFGDHLDDLANELHTVKGLFSEAFDVTAYIVDSRYAVAGFVSEIRNLNDAFEEAQSGYEEMLESTDELKDFWKVADPAGVATSAENAVKEFEAADKKRQEAADRRAKKENEARKAAEEAAKAREEEAKRAAEAHQRMFESMTLFANETRQFGGELSAIFLPFGELSKHLAVAQASASEFFLAWKTGIESSPTIGDLTLTGGPGANAGLKDIPDTWKKSSEEASKGIDLVRNAFNLLAKTGDSMASKLFAAGEIVVGAVQGIMNAASKGDVVSALIAAGSALINVFAGMGKTAQELIDTLDSVNSALDEVRSGSLTAAEAIDKATNWQGNEQGFAFLKAAVADFEAIGRTSMEAEAMVGAYWEAMRRGDQGAMERIGEDLINVAEQARLAREEQEKLNAVYDSVVGVYLRAKEAGEDAYKSTMDAAAEYQRAVAAGDDEKMRQLVENHGEWVRSTEAAQEQALAAQNAAAEQIKKKEHEKFVFMAALEAALEAIRSGNAAGAAAAAAKAAEEAKAAWATAMEAVEQADKVATEAIQDSDDAVEQSAGDAADTVKQELTDAAGAVEGRLKEMGGNAIDGFGRIVRRWKDAMSEMVDSTKDAAHEIQGGSIWPDMISDMVRETGLLLPAVDATMDAVQGFIREAEEAARREARRTRIERIKAIEDVAEREREWRALQIDLAKEWLSRQQRIHDIEERLLIISEDRGIRAADRRIKQIEQIKKRDLAIIDERIEAAEQQKAAALGAIDAQIEAAERQKTAALGAIDAQIKATERQKAAALGAIDAQIKATERQKAAALGAIDAQIEATEKAKAAALGAIDAQIEATERQKTAALGAIDAQIEATEKARDAALDAIDAQIEATEKARDAALDAIDAQIEATEKTRDAALDAIDARIEATEKAKTAALDAIDRETEAVKHRQKLYQEEHENRRRQIQDESDARLAAIDAEIAALEKKQFKSEEVWEAAKAFGIRDRSQLGAEFHAQQSSEKIKGWADQISLLQRGGLSDKQLAGNDVVRSRMARIVEDIEKHGLSLPEHLSGLAEELGYKNVKIGNGLAGVANQLEEAKKTREQIEQELHVRLEALNQERERIEDDFARKLEDLSLRRDAVEKQYDQRLASLRAHRDAVEKQYDQRLASLRAHRDAVEKQYDQKLANLRAHRDAVEKQYDQKLAALRAHRDAVEKQYDQKLAALRAHRDAVEKQYDQKLAALRAHRDAVEREYDQKLAALRAHRDAVEREYDQKLAALRAHRDAVEKEYDQKLAALRAHRDAVEKEWDQKLAALRAHRDAVEQMHDAHLARIRAHREEIEYRRVKRARQREEVERQRLQAELALLRSVQRLVNDVPTLTSRESFASGSGGIRNFRGGTPAMLHNREAVVTERSWLEAIERAARGGGDGGNEFHVVDMKWNGITLGRMNLRYGPKALHLEGVR